MTERPSDYKIQPDDAARTEPHTDDIRMQLHTDLYAVHVGDLLVGKRYKVLEIHSGGMGVVYKCEDLETHLIVALKTVQTEEGMTEAEVESMKRSFVRVHRLRHQHIIRVNHIERDDVREKWFVSMDWVDGEDLETWLKKQPRGSLSADETVRILEQVASALDYAHGEGIIHRDVKCANVMMERDGNVLLIDFGIAGRTPKNDATVATQGTFGLTVTVNPFTGTLGYQPPEQWFGEKTSAASDQYSLAVTAYRCLSGHLPFEHPNRAELREMVIYDEPPRIRSISNAANAVLKKALAKEAKDRYGSCLEFIRELANGLAATEVPQQQLIAMPTSSQTTVSTQQSSESKTMQNPMVPHQWEHQLLEATKNQKTLFRLVVGLIIVTLALGGKIWYDYKKDKEAKAANAAEAAEIAEEDAKKSVTEKIVEGAKAVGEKIAEDVKKDVKNVGDQVTDAVKEAEKKAEAAAPAAAPAPPAPAPAPPAPARW
ncbi:MAG: serine/threonine protein kinase [Lentisphaeria bacterium]|nr:serine/threonine protein kinase [Lentisphaeria bacterium]